MNEQRVITNKIYDCLNEEMVFKVEKYEFIENLKNLEEKGVIQQKTKVKRSRMTLSNEDIKIIGYYRRNLKRTCH